MTSITPISAGNEFGLFSNVRFSVRGYADYLPNRISRISADRPSASTFRKIDRLEQALRSLKSIRLSTSQGLTSSVVPGSAISDTLFGNSSTTLSSTAEINTAPTSFTKFGPNLTGATTTAPWSGLGSTAHATVGGTYDGSNGSGELTFRVTREGTHGEDDLEIRVYAADDSVIETINIKDDDPINKTYTLSNGLEISLGEGDLVKNDEFIVDTSLLSTSFTPNDPDWTGSTASAQIGGDYDGSDGTGQLTFKVTREGTHGDDDLQLKVYAPDDSFIQKIDVKKDHAIDKVYSLDNGLAFTLGEGDLIKNETFNVNVDASDPSATGPANPDWNVSTATATIGGTYDGSLGTGTMTFKSTTNGTHGEDDLRIKAYAPDGSFLENVDIDKEDSIDTVYTLSNGLTFTLSAGDLIKNETFGVDIEASTTFSTSPHPVESTAEVTIGGIYDGSQGTGLISFRITQGGTHGTDDLAVEVYGPDDNLMDTIDVLQSDPADKVYTLSNGLTFQLGAGTLVVDETFSVDVDHQTGSSVDPDKAFDGLRNDNPNFDLGLSVTAGSFQVNGVTINVTDSDSVNSVLNKITQSAADVTATFDAATESVVLTRNTPGAGQTITLTNDTSGFLAATKLDNAIPDFGGGNSSTPIDQVAELAGVSSGTIQINGVSISLNVNNDSLDDMVDRINSSSANVTAVIDSQTDRLSITTNNGDLALSSGGTGFFEEIGIDDGVYESESTNVATKKGVSSTRRRSVTRAISDVSRALNALFESPDFLTAVDESLAAVRRGVKDVVTNKMDADSTALADNFGVSFGFDDASEDVFEFSIRDRKQLASRMRKSSDVAVFRELMWGSVNKNNGMIDKLLGVTKSARNDMIRDFGSAGHNIDVYL